MEHELIKFNNDRLIDVSNSLPVLPRQVHVSWIDLTLEVRSDITLAETERARANRFLFERDRLRFVAARTALRRLLAEYTHERPELLVFGTGRFGKPFLSNHPNLHFNVSHSGELMGVAISRRGPVGFDCERIESNSDLTSLCAHVCSPEEHKLILDEHSGLSRHRFFQMWTRKEAILKNVGIGLNFPLSNLTVLSKQKAASLSVHVESHGTFRVCSLDAPSGYAAACSVLSEPPGDWAGEIRK